MLLAPRNPDSYKTALRAYESIEDASALRTLARRVAEADLDLSDDLREAKRSSPAFTRGPRPRQLDRVHQVARSHR